MEERPLEYKSQLDTILKDSKYAQLIPQGICPFYDSTNDYCNALKLELPPDSDGVGCNMRMLSSQSKMMYISTCSLLIKYNHYGKTAQVVGVSTTHTYEGKGGDNGQS